LNPNSRKKHFRGKEIYYPPYNWLGLGLSVLGKFDDGNDDWLEDISEESEWAIAYRGISSKKQEHIKDMLKHFIEERNLEIARINFKDKFGKKLNDKRHWGTIESGIYMTPYIKIAEKFGFAKVYPISGQTYPRNLDVRVLNCLSEIAVSAYKMAEDIRLLQHNKEIEEPFGKNQIGSSAMGALSERPEVGGMALVITALAEGVSLWGFLIAFFILQAK